MKYNLLADVDAYKNCHWKMYAKDVVRTYSYLTARKGPVYWFGLRYYLMKYLTGKVVSLKKIKEAKQLIDNTIGKGVFNTEGWMNLLFKHNGRLPIEIRAAPELNLYESGRPLLTIENTDNEFPWLPSFIETLLVNLWYPTSVATQCCKLLNILNHYSEKTCLKPIGNQLFSNSGMRSASCPEAGSLASAAHLLFFNNTTAPAGIRLLEKYYNRNFGNKAPIGVEHSVITSYGEDNELSSYISCLNTFPELPITIPIDSYNIYYVAEKYFGEDLKDKILNRFGPVYVRPDSGNVIEVLQSITNILANKFGFTVNAKGYKVLNKIRIIQGDGISFNSLPEILESIITNGFSLENYKFGSGGALVHSDVSRDLFGFAQKLSWVRLSSGEKKDVCKNPITDPEKKSLAGRFEEKYKDLTTVFMNGSLTN